MTFDDLKQAAQIFNRINNIRSYVTKCHDFNDRMMCVRDVNDVADAVKILFEYVKDVITTWQRSVRTLTLENRWPEEEYISDVKFMEG